jgi:3-deoxy-manno-octulosonate cytidylyltransferase (CMP-KDO synthetase)
MRSERSIIAVFKAGDETLEISEKIECIRYLEYGMKIKMIETNFVGVGIDTPEDLEKARKLM